jgi:hypothetical protein
MSFVGVLKTIWHGIEAGATDVAPYTGVISAIPVFGGPAAIAIKAIVAVEGILPSPGNGPAKKAAVTALVTSAVPTVNSAQLSAAIDEIVAALNALTAATSKVTTNPPAGA